MRPIFSALLGTLALGLAVCLPAQANVTEELYQATGMNQHQDHFQFALKAAQQRYSRQLPANLYETLVQQSNQRFEPQGMRDRAMARLAVDLDEADQSEILKFYRSDLGRQVVGAETRATSPASIVAMQRGLPQHELSDSRRQLVEKLSDVLPALDLGVEVSLSLASLAAQSANSFFGGLMQIPDSAVANQRERLRQEMRPNLPDTLAHVYRDLSDEQLRNLIEWSQSTTGREYYEAAELAVRDALNP
ncbi:hypothetical protein SAMN05216421_0079 [Halopseudomonas xinjiangensis]|uniref:DUF2059 domain-containing protein n=1 Tax=Halopseudomonas xinjiangensis TaxID=487184 RepID=A0A1H1L7Q0_9GAMM|nr:DUF2059 domain-containing protein [Halopseudomonas xinjiangensis]SDR70614.1 hypothetical protein SAMN05216421_0079 [Halopseudomonas xinjiangensis]